MCEREREEGQGGRKREQASKQASVHTRGGEGKSERERVCQVRSCRRSAYFIVPGAQLVPSMAHTDTQPIHIPRMY